MNGVNEVRTPCPEWCIAGDHSGDFDDPVHLAFRATVPGNEGEVLIEVSSADASYGDLSLDVLGEATFSDEDEVGELLVVLAEGQAALSDVRATLGD